MSGSRVMIAAAGSGSGKTVISCALMRILKNSGSNVVPFKCGPDYIDPMYHRAALGMNIQALDKDGFAAPGGNPDTFFTDEKTTIDLMYEGGFDQADIAVIEGVMGLYDGLGGTSLKGSSYELACMTKTPVILVVDAKGKGRSILALIKGFLDYDDHNLIRGIILNRINRMYFDKLKALIETELDIRVAGFVPEDERLRIGSRHLGLMTPKSEGCETGSGDGFEDVLSVIEAAESILGDTVDIRLIHTIADSADKLDRPAGLRHVPVLPFLADKKIGTIAVAVDEAFCFYYRENLRYLKALGMDLIPFSPLHDDRLPEKADAVLLGGGYPEEYLKELSENLSMKSSIKKAADDGKFIIAECGGFMYLQKEMEDKEGKAYEMAGVLEGRCRWTGKLTRFGYVELSIRDTVIRGHEFHYYDSDCNGEDIKVRKAGSGKEYLAMYDRNNILAGFPHLYYYDVRVTRS